MKHIGKGIYIFGKNENENEKEKRWAAVGKEFRKEWEKHHCYIKNKIIDYKDLLKEIKGKESIYIEGCTITGIPKDVSAYNVNTQGLGVLIVAIGNIIFKVDQNFSIKFLQFMGIYLDKIIGIEIGGTFKNNTFKWKK